MYKVNIRKLNTTSFLSITTLRAGVEVTSAEKVLPATLEFDESGEYKVLGPKEILESLEIKNYYLGKDFTAEKIAEYTVSSIYAQLAHYPTLPRVGGSSHPMAELLYSNRIDLKPVQEFQEKLNKLEFLDRGKVLSSALSKLSEKFTENTGKKLDLYSVPKRKVGTFCYIADSDGIAKIAKIFSFGFHKAIPRARLVREYSSFKACEKFNNPQEVPFPLPEEVKPYVSMLRVGIVNFEKKGEMLDGVDLYPAAIPKISCTLRKEIVEKDVLKVPVERRNLKYTPYKAGIEIVHFEEEIVNEDETNPGAIRFVLPGGVKLAGQLVDDQGFSEDGPIDCLMDFESFVAKGSVAIFAMDKENYCKELSLEECKKIALSRKTTRIWTNDNEYLGYVIDIPVIRPGQKYTELSKSAMVTEDLVAKAILKKQYTVRKDLAEEYENLKAFRTALNKELSNG